jgi:nickel-dependent lactate racemase
MGRLGLCFFDKTVEVFVPDDMLVAKLETQVATPLANVREATIEAMNNPIGANPLKEAIRKGRRVLLTFPDKSRHTDIREVLSAVLGELEEAGVRQEDISLLAALGTHRPMTPAEIAAKIGEVVAKDYQVLNHDYDNPEYLVNLGHTSDGLPVEFNRTVKEHDYIISLGNISAHPVGGYSGGAKGLLPGIAGKRSTDYFHWEACKYPLFDIFGNPDNPVRREMESIVAEVGLDFIVNTTENSRQEITGIFAGHFIKAHRKGVEFLRRTPLIPFPTELPDVMVVGTGSDRPDFWGGAAGVYAASALLKDGGILVLMAACPEGLAPEHPVVSEYGYPRWREVIEKVERGEVEDRTGASHVVTVGKILEGKEMKVFMVSEGVGPEDAEKAGFRWFAEPQEAIDEAIRAAGRNARVLVYERI